MNTSFAVAHDARFPRRTPTRRPAQAHTDEIDLAVQLAHDIRSPLSGILMLAESLREGTGGPVTPSQRRQLDLIHGAALSLCESASDVVRLAMEGQGLADELPDVFSVSEVLRMVRDMALPLASGKRLDLRIVPPPSDRRHGCSRAIARVLLNLTTNALKGTEKGEVEITARHVAGDRDRLEFSVRDSGPGLRTAVFRAFDKPSGAAPNRDGSLTSAGLGLSICRRLLEQLGSSLRYETSPRDGTRFFFELFLPCV